MDLDRQKHKEKQVAVCGQIRKDVSRCEQNYEQADNWMLLRMPASAAPFHGWIRIRSQGYRPPYLGLRGRKDCPMQAYHRLLPSVAVALAKKRARGVILTLLLVGRRARWPQAPREIWQRILAEVNKAVCDL